MVTPAVAGVHPSRSGVTKHEIGQKKADSMSVVVGEGHAEMMSRVPSQAAGTLVPIAIPHAEGNDGRPNKRQRQGGARNFTSGGQEEDWSGDARAAESVGMDKCVRLQHRPASCPCELAG